MALPTRLLASICLHTPADGGIPAALAQFWLNLQCMYDLETAREQLEEQVDREVLPVTQ